MGIGELLMHHLPFDQKEFTLTLIDANEQALLASKALFRSKLRTFAEKNINPLRRLYAEEPTLISNEEIIASFLTRLFDRVTFSTAIESARTAEWIFEAVPEEIELKKDLFNALRKMVSLETLFFSNTSAIPIRELGERVVGFHFYNPPTHNKMLEIVGGVHRPVAEQLAKELKRTYVFAGDVPGFIGNGHYIRELRFALDLGLPPDEVDALYEKKLLRPFGPFKLAAFIGIPTVISIGKIMGIDCSPLAGIQIDPKTLKPYRAPPDAALDLEDPHVVECLRNSRNIAEHLVESGAAPDLAGVDTVLTVGFQHPYGIQYV